jgi:hypothetical protein
MSLFEEKARIYLCIYLLIYFDTFVSLAIHSLQLRLTTSLRLELRVYSRDRRFSSAALECRAFDYGRPCKRSALRNAS